tara:strand:+ start:2159 stop:2638 length:480 start_codon:yes stop_codon:yes gene_type:complete
MIKGMSGKQSAPRVTASGGARPAERPAGRLVEQLGGRRAFVAVLWLVSAILLAPGVSRAESFFQQLPDLPLMAGLTEVPEAGLLFDKPEGRIAEALARGVVGAGPDPAEVLAFYRRSLPQLGWRESAAPATFWRENEQLVLDIQQAEDRLLLRILLSPR